ncbi:5'-adenylylsulfate reductase-like 4 [Camellia sinensis]|uniref:5'-adenylylsulfate reductase-like 4 n=1 Tax=Camellia sinensis TaxID=4442 RepID=UPI00103565A2|nr:5'-adenylylsulfate reductase-like 4 [Camellia sinensis]
MIRHRVQQFLDLLPVVGVIVLQNTQNLISGDGDCSGRLTTAQLLLYHGFPSLFLLNSTMRVCYHGSRTLGSLVSFYDDVTGLKTEPLNGTYLERIGQSSDDGKNNHPEQESCPFSWARSPENLLQQETYLALATAFVLLRLLYFLLPTLSACTRLVWRLYIPNMKLKSLWEHPPAYLNRAIQLFNSLKEPCKRSNLQEEATNAKAWASKSLASVSFGNANTSWVVPVS